MSNLMTRPSRIFNGIFDDVARIVPQHDIPFRLENGDDKIVAYMDVPGFTKDQIKVKLKGRTVFIEGEKSNKSTASTWVGKIANSFIVPLGTKPEHISVVLENGVLMVSVAKTEENREEFIIPIA